MKKIVFIFNLFVSLCFPLSANIVYRQAIPADAKQLISMFKNFSQDDNHKLLVFPDRIQSDIINDSISKGKLFVACDDKISSDDKTSNIVSFLKLYTVGHDEINDTLSEELNLGLKSPLLENCCYDFPATKAIDFKQPIKQITLTQDTKDCFLSKTDEDLVRSGTDSCLYLYHGSAYTLPLYRGKGLSTQLLSYAFNSITTSLKNKKFLALLYGQVNANTSNFAMVRVFADFVAHTFPKQSTNGVILQHLYSRAYKPDFDTQGNLKIICDEEHEGRGSMVVYSVKA